MFTCMNWIHFAKVVSLSERNFDFFLRWYDVEELEMTKIFNVIGCENIDAFQQHNTLGLIVDEHLQGKIHQPYACEKKIWILP